MKVGFAKFFAIAQAILLVALFAIWSVPRQLGKMIPEFWAYALPILLLFNAIYFVPPLDGSKRGAWGSGFCAVLFSQVCSAG